MPAENLDTWSLAVKIATRAALRDLLDAHETDPATITIHDASDVLLATIELGKPCAVINEGTGQMTFTQAAREEEAPAGGTPSYASIRDGAGAAHRSLPCEVGSEPVAGKCVLNTGTIVAGGPVEIVSATIG